MAVTFTVSSLVRDNVGSARLHTGTLAVSGTTTDDGDAITAAQFGLTSIKNLQLSMAAVSGNETAFIAHYDKPNAKIIFYTAVTSPDGAKAEVQVTDGTDVSGTAYFSALGL